MTPLSQRTLQVAKRYLGASETEGSNRGPVIATFQMWFGRWMLGQPWCAAFATFCVNKAAEELGVKDPVIKSASSSAIFAWAHKEGRILPFPESGCIGLVRGGPTGHEHTFLVHTVDHHEVVTVEGNLSNRVRWNRRQVSGLYDWVRI